MERSREKECGLHNWFVNCTLMGQYLLVFETHAGHKTKLSGLHLSISEKNIIIEKLKSDVSINRILEDARKTESPELQRIHLTCAF